MVFIENCTYNEDTECYEVDCPHCGYETSGDGFYEECPKCGGYLG